MCQQKAAACRIQFSVHGSNVPFQTVDCGKMDIVMEDGKAIEVIVPLPDPFREERQRNRDDFSVFCIQSFFLYSALHRNTQVSLETPESAEEASM